uniref:Uncharacterized protein n=1 Tax=Candidatus Kentrum sp. UNK TaxID=2126344 RepID=A0A451B3Y0_9GAMM|nr:MAG: hypothetical protein BECKUNK1418G_GA0071005_12111 [Candidatus Kentron sp. UNK]VFK72999.1 MAG: hypothetical protein BECKUNK1418H_GA0071006_11565 [Candidatus Kentron sp. UNK]
MLNLPPLSALARSAGMFMFRKNKNSEKIGARARNTPFGAWREAFGFMFSLVEFFAYA